MKKIDQVLNQVLNDIVPLDSDRKKIKIVVKDLKKKLLLECRKVDITSIIDLEGSVAKDTWLKEDPDIDIFIRLPITMPRKDLDQIIIKIAKRATKNSKHIERYAEHPYLETFIDNIRVNIVPCYQVEIGNWKSATDRTPYHTKYINKHLSPELKNEVRLLKKFFKGINVYGAEIRIGGFSGYLCELLILHYKSFIKTIEAFSKYKKTIMIDQNNHYFNNKIDPTVLFSDPIIVIDPVDKNRNVASALKSEKLYALIGAARAFLLEPSTEFFFPQLIDIFSLDSLKSKFKNRGSSILFILVDNIDAVPDVLWGQLYKTQRSLRKLLKTNDFKILRDTVWTNKKTLTFFIIEVETYKLPKIKQHIGPPLEFEEQSTLFLTKYSKNTSVFSGPYIQNNRWVILLDRIYYDAKILIGEKLITDSQNLGIPKPILKAFKRKFGIFVDYEIANLYQNNSEFAAFISSFLEGKPFWLKSYYDKHNQDNT
jgi:tRNA nucleotidyltransferase (CCA-adding enzyme)